MTYRNEEGKRVVIALSSSTSSSRIWLKILIIKMILKDNNNLLDKANHWNLIAILATTKNIPAV